MRVIVIGTVRFSLELVSVINQHAELVGVITSSSSALNSDYVDLAPYCKDHNIPCLQTSDVNLEKTLHWVREKNADIIFCLGWSRLITRSLLDSVSMGVVGYHPAALPKNRGRHPLIWALALGLEETASTFFVMDEGVDSGDIVSQVNIQITPNDDATSLYKKMVDTAKLQLPDLLKQLDESSYTRIQQDYVLSNTWRKRGIPDGEIDWRMSVESIHNLIRALTHPYVGAHFVVDGKPHIVWNSMIVKCRDVKNIEPGKVLKADSSRLVIKCGDGCLELIDIEPPVNMQQGEYL